MRLEVSPGDLRSTDGRNARFQRFTAVGEVGRLRVCIDVECTDPARPRCRSLRIEPTGNSATVVEIASLPLQRLVLDAIAAASTWIRVEGATDAGGTRFTPVPGADKQRMRRAYTSSARQRRNAPPPPWEVAAVCLKARKAGENEAAAVVAQLHTSKTRAYAWIKSARAQGFLD